MLTNDHAARLATEHDARTLAAALLARLRADGRESVASAVETALSSYIGAAIDGTPPNPHRELGGIIDPNPTPGHAPAKGAGAVKTTPADADFINGQPNPHRGGADSCFIDPTPPNPHEAQTTQEIDAEAINGNPPHPH